MNKRKGVWYLVLASTASQARRKCKGMIGRCKVAVTNTVSRLPYTCQWRKERGGGYCQQYVLVS